MGTVPTFSNRDPHHPQYFVRQYAQGVTVAGTGSVGAVMVAPAYTSLHYAVAAIVKAGTATTAVLDFITITGTGGTTTTTLASSTVGTSTAFSTFTAGFLASGIGTKLQQGELAYVTSRLDATVTAAVVWDMGFPENSMTADPARPLNV